ncbi:MAG: hypothetical protein HY907_03045 [Deltaproteobacteria bacterium]|nr:hypothetical protein [Deltaproteobacteria bacterium]
MIQRRGITRALAAAACATLLAVGAPAHAQGQDLDGFFIEVPMGLGTPLAEDAYETLYDPSFWTGVNLGWLFEVGGGSVAIGPAVDIQYAFGNVEEDWREDDAREDDLYLGRFRAIGGARFVAAVGDAYILTRLGLGLDLAHSSWDYYRGGSNRIQGDHSDLSLGVTAGVGMGYRITELIGVTFLLDLPIGFHDESESSAWFHWNGELIDLLLSVAVDFYL